MKVSGKVVTIENNIEIDKQAGGVYQGSRLTYRDSTGALKEQAFHNNALKFNPQLKTAMLNLAVNDAFTMTKEKEGEFWNVKSITVGEAVPDTPTNKPSSIAPKSTYETAEERAKKQIFIVRQSTITAALSFLGGKAKDTAQVLAIAKEFENYVFNMGYVAEPDDEVY